MARRPDLGKREEIWSRKDLDEIMHNLSLLSEHGVREFYLRAYRVRHHQLADVSSAAGRPGTGAGLETTAEMEKVVRIFLQEIKAAITDLSSWPSAIPRESFERLPHEKGPELTTHV